MMKQPTNTRSWNNFSLTKEKCAQGSDHRGAVKAQEKLRDQLAPRYQWLFTHMGRLEGGVKFLVDLRTDVLVRIQFLFLHLPKYLEFIFRQYFWVI
jgi:hypothetical protein